MTGCAGKGAALKNLDHRIKSRVTENISQTVLKLCAAEQLFKSLQRCRVFNLHFCTQVLHVICPETFAEALICPVIVGCFLSDKRKLWELCQGRD